MVLNGGSPNGDMEGLVVCGPAASAPWNWLEMQILRPCCITSGSQTLGWSLAFCVQRLSGGCGCSLKFKNQGTRELLFSWFLHSREQWRLLLCSNQTLRNSGGLSVNGNRGKCLPTCEYRFFLTISSFESPLKTETETF